MCFLVSLQKGIWPCLQKGFLMSLQKGTGPCKRAPYPEPSLGIDFTITSQKRKKGWEMVLVKMKMKQHGTSKPTILHLKPTGFVVPNQQVSVV